MSESWNQYLDEDRRLAILRILEAQDGYALNESVMQAALERIGHNVSRDRVRADMAWLAEQGLVTVEVVARTIHVAKLTTRGQDIAAARSVHPGVKRPSAGS